MQGGGRDGPSRRSREFGLEEYSPTVAVVESVAQFRDEDPFELEPLADWVDPGALNQIIQQDNGDVVVRFRWGDVWVMVDSDTITVTEVRTAQLD